MVIGNLYSTVDQGLTDALTRAGGGGTRPRPREDDDFSMVLQSAVLALNMNFSFINTAAGLVLYFDERPPQPLQPHKINTCKWMFLSELYVRITFLHTALAGIA